MTHRTDIANAFKAARPLIKSGRQIFICMALARASPPAWESAREVIQERIDGLFTLESWLRNKHSIAVHNMHDEMRAYRLRWLNHLIREFSK